MSLLKDIAQARKNCYQEVREAFGKGYVHGSEWCLKATTEWDDMNVLYDGTGRITKGLIDLVVQENQAPGVEIYIEGRVDWSPCLYDYNKYGEYHPGEYWDVRVG